MMLTKTAKKIRWRLFETTKQPGYHGNHVISDVTPCNNHVTHVTSDDFPVTLDHQLHRDHHRWGEWL